MPLTVFRTTLALKNRIPSVDFLQRIQLLPAYIVKESRVPLKETYPVGISAASSTAKDLPWSGRVMVQSGVSLSAALSATERADTALPVSRPDASRNCVVVPGACKAWRDVFEHEGARLPADAEIGANRYGSTQVAFQQTRSQSTPRSEASLSIVEAQWPVPIAQ